jgi:hypothetical protein
MTETIFKQEEKAILLSVDKAKASSNNSQIIGRNGEKPLLDFLNNYLPTTLKAVSGHFITKDLIKSPQIDILIVDSRYPFLGYNNDGTVLVMAHSVLRVIEIKTNLTSKDISKTAENIAKTKSLIIDLWPGEDYSFNQPTFELIAYRITVKEQTIMNTYFQYCEPIKSHFGVTVLRSQKQSESGLQLYFHPTSNWDDFNESEHLDEMKGEYLFGAVDLRTPLSDFYYSLIQDSYYALAARNYGFDEIGNHFNDYINWSTVRP